MVSANDTTVYVGLSGGVDSAVSAARLVDAGYNVVGVFIITWHPEWLPCSWKDDRRDAMRVAAHLGIPFIELDLSEKYYADVAQEMIDGYKRCETPNPDVLCNSSIKFGGFLKWARSHGADYVATGHYAQVKHNGTKGYLYRGIDAGKDQSYFLWSLDADTLGHAMFPVGDTKKEHLRVEAQKRKLPVASKPDSQGICFLGDVDLEDFLGRFIDLKPGKVINTEGEEIGEHNGASLYTKGQRRGFTVTKRQGEHGPWYVVDKNCKDNTITVDLQPKQAPNGYEIQLRDMVVRTPGVMTGSVALECQTRYHGFKYPVRVVGYNDKHATVSIPLGDALVTKGQSLVLYQKDECIGGGVIESYQEQ